MALPAFVWVPPSKTWSLPGLSGTPASAPPGVTLPGVAGRRPSEIPLAAAGTTAVPRSVSVFLPGNASVGSPPPLVKSALARSGPAQCCFGGVPTQRPEHEPELRGRSEGARPLEAHTGWAGGQRGPRRSGGAPPGIRRRKAGSDQGTTVGRPWPREFRKASAPDCRGRGARERRGRAGPLYPEDRRPTLFPEEP